MWKPIRTAPRDKVILLNVVGYLEPTLGVWNNASKKWAYAALQCDQHHGKWCDTYFHTEYDGAVDSKGQSNITHWRHVPNAPRTKR
jgi:hypothetical protein